MDINGIVAFITGGVNGIGLVTATELLRKGAKNVTLVDIDYDAAGTVVDKLNKEFGNDKAIFLKVDVSNTSELEDAFKKTLQRFGTIDFVFNNAGMANELNVKKTVDVNLIAVIAGTQLAYKYLGKHNGGKGGIIINTSSMAVLTPPFSLPTYTATKFGVLGLSRAYGGTDTKTVRETIPLEENIHQQHNNAIKSYIFQPVDGVGKHVVNIIKIGENGSVWLIDQRKNYLVKIPTFKNYEKTEFPLE